MIRALFFVLLVFLGSYSAAHAVTILTTNSSDTLNTFRTNSNTNFDNLNSAISGFVSSASVIGTSSPIAAGAAVLYATGVNTAASVATSTFAVSGPFTVSGTLGYFVGGANSTVTYYGLSTTTSPTAGHLLYSSGGAGVTSIATTTLAGGTTGLSFSNSPVVIGSSASTLSGTLALANGGTATTTFVNGGVVFYNSTLTTLSQGTTASDFFYDVANARLGLGTSTPFGLLSINPIATNGTTRPFVIGSSSQTTFAVGASGHIQSAAKQAATSTAIVLDWANTPPVVEYRIGHSATTITLINATTAAQYGSRKLIPIWNPNGTAGALTFNGIEFSSAYTQTTSANRGDLISCFVGMATSSTAYKVICTAGSASQ